MIELSVALGLVTLVLVLTVVSIRRDARWLGNAYLFGLSVLVVLPVLALIPGLGLLVVFGGLLLLVLAPLATLVLIGFLIANGVQMLRRERRSFAHLLSLLAGIGIAVVLALALVVLFTGATPLAPVATFAVLALGYLGGEFVLYLGYSWVYARLARRSRPSHIVVLGAGLRGGREVGPLLAGRVDHAIGVYRRERDAGREPVLVMSGGQGPDEQVSEAAAMADYAVRRGVLPAHILQEDRSTNTLENLRFSRQVVLAHAGRSDQSELQALAAQADDAAAPAIEEGQAQAQESGVAIASRIDEKPRLPWFAPPLDASMLVVTSDYHAMRAATHARKVRLPAHAIGAPTARYYWVSAVLREFIALVNERRVKHLVLLALVALPLTLVVLAVQI